MMVSKINISFKTTNRHTFDNAKWNLAAPQSHAFQPGYVKLEENLQNISISYTTSYVGKNTNRGVGIRLNVTTHSGQMVEATYEFAGSAAQATKFMQTNQLFNGIFGTKNAQLIAYVGESKFWMKLKTEGKISFSIPSNKMQQAETVTLNLHKDARLMRLEYNGNGNGLDIITKITHPSPPPEWVWLVFELKTTAMHNLDVAGFKSVSPQLSKVQKKGLEQVKLHVDASINRYLKGNPYGLSKAEYNEMIEFQKAVDNMVDGNSGNVVGLLIGQGLTETFDYAVNLKHVGGMRVVKGWFGEYSIFNSVSNTNVLIEIPKAGK